MCGQRHTCRRFCVKNPSVSLSSTLAKNEKVEHYIRIKTYKPIALRFWVESGVNALWIMDSRASFHTTPSLELLSNYVPEKFGKVYLTDGKYLDIIGKKQGSLCGIRGLGI